MTAVFSCWRTCCGRQLCTFCECPSVPRVSQASNFHPELQHQILYQDAAVLALQVAVNEEGFLEADVLSNAASEPSIALYLFCLH